jgi:hypothetical protein
MTGVIKAMDILEELGLKKAASAKVFHALG